MTSLDYLLIASLCTVLLILPLMRFRSMGWVATLFYLIQLFILVSMKELGSDGAIIESGYRLTVLGHSMSWRFDALSWLLGLITIGAAFFTSWYASGSWGEKFTSRGGNTGLLHLALGLNVFSMLLLLSSGDFLSLFIGWELVSWSSFLLMAFAGGAASRAALKYVTYAVGGAMAILAGMMLLYQHSGSFQYGDFIASVDRLGVQQIWLLYALFGCGFAVKMGLIPFHLWQVAAYAETPGPGSAFLGAISARMGLYAMLVVLFQLIGIASIKSLHIPFTFMNGQTLMSSIAVFTIILPTYTALKQNDARMLLAWHGIGQGGYMLLGLSTGSALGGAGGILHIFNHAVCQAALLLSVFAVRHQTGTSDLNKLGGLITRMPVSYFVLLVGIIGLAGLPPMNGFVSKWMIYRSLMLEGMPLFFIGAIIGTLGTILSVYKLIHNMYLGQLRLEHQNVREVSWSMVVPMVSLGIIIFITGLMPGLVLKPIAAIQAQLGMPVITYTLGGVDIVGGSLDMLWIVGVLFGGFGVGAVLFYSTGRTHHIHQLDNYAGGHFLSADTRYQYSDNFYAGLMRVIDPLYRHSFNWLEVSIHSLTGLLGSAMRVFYANAQPTFFMLVSVVILMAWVLL